MEASKLIRILEDQDIVFATGVPCSIFSSLIQNLSNKQSIKYIGATNEGEAVSIAAGMECAGSKPIVLMQNSGLGNAFSPITSLLAPYKITIPLLVSHRGCPGMIDEPQHELVGQITEKLCNLFGLKTLNFNEDNIKHGLQNMRQSGKSVAWIVEKNAIENSNYVEKSDKFEIIRNKIEITQTRFSASLTRLEAIRTIVEELEANSLIMPAIIASTGKIARETFTIPHIMGDAKNRFCMVGSMGCASSFGLGVAMGVNKSKPVVILDGDGSALMRMESLATIGHIQPENLIHIILDNGAHDSTGGQKTITNTLDLAGVATVCGYVTSTIVETEGDIVKALKNIYGNSGPHFLRVIVNRGTDPNLPRPSKLPHQVWQEFKEFLQQ